MIRPKPLQECIALVQRLSRGAKVPRPEYLEHLIKVTDHRNKLLEKLKSNVSDREVAKLNDARPRWPVGRAKFYQPRPREIERIISELAIEEWLERYNKFPEANARRVLERFVPENSDELAAQLKKLAPAASLS